MQDAAPAMARNADHAAVDLGLDLSAAQHVWISQTTLALLLRSGQMVLVHLTVEAGFVRQMKVSHCVLCCLVLLVQYHWIGDRHDCQLVLSQAACYVMTAGCVAYPAACQTHDTTPAGRTS